MDETGGAHRKFPLVVPDGGHGPIFGEQAAQFVQSSLAFLRGAELLKNRQPGPSPWSQGV